jgi:hypothetical protein
LPFQDEEIGVALLVNSSPPINPLEQLMTWALACLQRRWERIVQALAAENSEGVARQEDWVLKTPAIDPLVILFQSFVDRQSPLDDAPLKDRYQSSRLAALDCGSQSRHQS